MLTSESKHRPFQGLPPSPEPGAEAEQTHYSSSSRDWGELTGRTGETSRTPLPVALASCVGWPAPGR